MQITACQRLTNPDCEDHIVKLTLNPVNNEHLKPFITGQFIRVGIPNTSAPAPTYFAIASAPFTREGYDLVVKSASGMSQYLSHAQAGTILEVEGPMGKGFDLRPYKGMNVVLMGAGTGIAPLRSVWQWLINHREEYKDIYIYAGFLTPLHRVLTDELQALQEHDIHVSVSLASGDQSWDGPIGFVQDALKANPIDGLHAVACLAGMSPMVDACTETLQNLGFDDTRILLNF
ncbi:MAG: hydrogenase [Zetaproteobacteria bacterium]|nr:hydrogenase [Zetaproteobacteria bacterium]